MLHGAALASSCEETNSDDAILCRNDGRPRRRCGVLEPSSKYVLSVPCIDTISSNFLLEQAPG